MTEAGISPQSMQNSSTEVGRADDFSSSLVYSLTGLGIWFVTSNFVCNFNFTVLLELFIGGLEFGL